MAGAGHGDQAVGRQQHDLNHDEEVEQIRGQKRAGDTRDQHKGQGGEVACLGFTHGDGEPVGGDRHDHGCHQHYGRELVAAEGDTYAALVLANDVANGAMRGGVGVEPDAAGEVDGGDEDRQSVVKLLARAQRGDG